MAVKGTKQSPEHIAARIAAIRSGKGFNSPGPPKYTPERLWAKVQKGKEDECWLWLGYRNQQGYGRVWLGNKGHYAHRVIYALAYPGIISIRGPSSDTFLRHSCDNPGCCNPLHLLIGTHAENMQDKVDRCRQARWKKTEEAPNAKLLDDDVRWMRLLYKSKRATIRAIALLYDVSYCAAKNAISGRSYSEVA